ncbi:fibronectin type III domain protein [Vibrio ponticus]|nr:fibronectin type III domain protein [Vibrio ponticus]
MIYKSPEAFPQQLYIEYEVTSPNGDVRKDLLLLINAESLPEGSPRFINIEPVSIFATELFTPIANLSPRATDFLGNPLPVSIASNQPRLRPGNHVVYWQSDNVNTGQTQLAGQLFRVHPLVTLGQGKYIYEGHQSSVQVHLNGPAPNYPVTVPILIDETLSTSGYSDHSLAQTQNVVITSGLEGELVFDVNTDELVENEERLVLKLSSEVNAGAKNELTLLIKESEPTPVINAYVQNENSEFRSVVPVSNSEELYLVASIDNVDSPIQVLWSYAFNNEEKIPIGEVAHTQKLLLDLPLKIGRYRFFVEANDLGGDVSIDASVDLRITDTTVLKMDNDSDNDGIPDLAEGLLDSDGDLIPDYIDAINGCEIQIIDNNRARTGGFVLQSSSGSCIKLGHMSQAHNTYSPYVEGSKVRPIADIPIDVLYAEEFSNSNVSNFLVTNVQDESISVVLPLIRH